MVDVFHGAAKALPRGALGKPMNPLAADLDHILAHTGEVWEELRGQRIFITGGTGFFGCWLLESFIWANAKLGLGASATVLTRDPEAFQKKAPHLAGDPSVRLVRGDVRTFPFPEGTYSHIIHAATESSKPVEALEMLDSIVEGTRRTLDFALKCRARKFLLTSSGAVYGKQPPEMTHIPETYMGAPDTMLPESAYGEGKRGGELLCALYHARHGLETKVARCFAFAGPYLPLDAHFAIGNFIRDGLAGGPIRVKGDGTPQRSYLYAADLMVWLWTILIKGEPCYPYNVGSDKAMSIREIAASVADPLALKVEVQTLKPELREQRQAYIPNTGRAVAELFLVDRINISESIRRTKDWASTPQSDSESRALRTCPICDGVVISSVHNQEFLLPQDHPLVSGYRVVTCLGCGFIYADSLADQESYDKFYTNLSKYEDTQTSTGGGESSYDSKRLRDTADSIALLMPNRDARIADVGCANGGLLSALRNSGYENLVGVDPSATCVRNVIAKGIHAATGSLTSIPG